MQQHHHELGASGADGARVGEDTAWIDQLDQPRPIGRKPPAVQPIGVAEDPHAEPADGDDGALVGFVGTAGHAGVTQPGRVHDIQGGRDPLRSLVHGVVRGGGAGVVAGPAQRRRQLSRRVECRPRRDLVTITRQRHLQMAQGQVRPSDQWTEVGEHGPEVIGLRDAPAIGSRLLQDRTMGQHVAGGDQGEPPASGVVNGLGRGPSPGPEHWKSFGVRRIPRRAAHQRTDEEQEDAEAANHHSAASGQAPAAPPPRRQPGAASWHKIRGLAAHHRPASRISGFHEIAPDPAVYDSEERCCGAAQRRVRSVGTPNAPSVAPGPD